MPETAPPETRPGTAAATRRPVFVMAVGRSGTTLLRVKLGALPGVIGFPESCFWSVKESHRQLDLADAAGRARMADAVLARQEIRNWRVDETLLRAELAERGTSWRDAFEVLVARYIEEKGEPGREITHWCEKSPPHIFRRASILEDYPEARFVYLVRDPRGVAASMKSCNWAHNNVYLAARLWRSAARLTHEDERSLVLRYEDLASEPEETMARVAEFVGVPFDTRAVRAETRDPTAARHAWTAEAVKPVTDRNVDNWRTRLCSRDREVELVQHVCRAEMERFGYELRRERRDARFRIQLAVKWTELALAKLFPG